MKKRISLSTALFLIIFQSIHCNAQEQFSDKWGRVSQYEMSMKEYEPDKDTEALVIYEKGCNRFITDDQLGFILYMEYKVKIKILKQSGIDYANFVIPYYTKGHEQERIIDIKGTTYNIEGNTLQKTELSSSNIFDEKHSENTNVKKFTMPNVKEGSVIEVSYIHTTPHFYRMKEWEFQKKIPVVSSTLEYRAIPYYEYTYILIGSNAFDVFESQKNNSEVIFGPLRYNEFTYWFGMKDLPAFKDEDFITSPRDYMTSLNLQLSKIYNPTGGVQTFMSTWPELTNKFLKLPEFGKYINQSEKEAKKKILPALNITDKTDLEKTKLLVDYVKNMYKWNSVYGKFAQSGKVSNFLKSKTGNSGDINLFLVGLLRGAGLDSNPIILSTRGHGLIRKTHPFESFLNYTIVEVNVDGQKIFIDATEPLLHYNELPTRCTNVDGLVIKPKSEEWIFTEQKTLATTNHKLEMTVDPLSQSAKIKASYLAHGNDAYHYRKVYMSNQQNLKDFLKKGYNIDVTDDIIVENEEDRDKPFRFNFTFNTSIEGSAEKLFIKPFSGLSVEQNPFTKASRTLPIDFIFLGGNSYESEIEIPKGYKVESLPNTTKINNKLLEIGYSAKVEGNKIIVKAYYERKSNIYPADSYIYLKNIYSGMIDRFSEMIVLTLS